MEAGSVMAPPGALVRSVMVQSVTGLALSALLLFVPAGTLAWPQGWAFLILFYVGTEATTLWLLRHDRELLVERMRSPVAAGQPPRARAVMIAILVAFLGWIVFMALDARRFGWSHAPLVAHLLGAGLMILAFLGWFAVLRANSFAATTIRLQADRSQTVITTGPYAIVRHPMYASSILFMVGAPLVLGSLWGLLGLAVLIPLLAARVLGEEALLRDGLAGYVDYARKVRFRLLPGIW
jgi:protein-S-isoprenylcysteine O-methyltransferase Ste14